MRFAVKAALLLGLTLLLFGPTAGVAWAQSYGDLDLPGDDLLEDRGGTVYMTDRYFLQTRTPNINALPPGPWNSRMKSFSPLKWVQGGSMTYVIACSVPFATYLDISDTVATYNALFPDLPLTYITDCNQEAAADLVFYVSLTVCGTDRGCEYPADYALYGDAWWPTKSVIFINDSYPSNQRRWAVAHELGHLYGLDEGYVEDRRRRQDGAYETIRHCNYGQSASVMDAADCDNYPLAPTALDQQRITAYWTAQAPTVIGSTPSGGNLVHVWRSNGYTETQAYYSAQRWTGSSYLQYDFGSRYIENLDELNYKWHNWRTALSTIPTSIPSSSPHRMCIQTFSSGVYGWGPYGCTEYTLTDAVGVWRLDEGSGLTAYDSSGLGNHGTLYNGPLWVTGKAGYGLDFDGVNDYVLIPHSPSLPFSSTSPWSVSQWVNYQGTGNYFPQFSKGGTTYGFTLHGLDGRIQGGDGAGHTFDQYNMFQQNLPGAGWTHTVITYNGSIFQAYVNGQAKGAFTWTWGIGTSADSLLLGAFWGPYYDGQMDEVRVYNRVLSLSEIQFLYNNPGG
ncbi:MAG: ImmA/IrrE family metallo-endopeptidase [Chloroflexi bacterium]|nr:ImmA/IrrE family metallo-endopeptidase [Chloroflexota bacterium]